jgi:curli biogenesis system outer membrane secretion channel CsgG
MKKFLLTVAVFVFVMTGLSTLSQSKEKNYPACANRPTVAVDTFRTENIYIGWDQFSGNARDVVVNELTNSGCFKVVERGEGLVSRGYDKEQAIKNTVGRQGQRAAKSQNVTLASRLVQFALTGVSENNVGGSLSGFGVGGGNFGLGSVAPRSSAIEMTCRIYDSSTSEVLASSRVKKSKVDIGLLGAGGGNLAFGGDFFYKTPLGKTIAGLIHDCSVDLASRTQNIPE